MEASLTFGFCWFDVRDNNSAHDLHTSTLVSFYDVIGLRQHSKLLAYFASINFAGGLDVETDRITQFSSHGKRWCTTSRIKWWCWQSPPSVTRCWHDKFSLYPFVLFSFVALLVQIRIRKKIEEHSIVYRKRTTWGTFGRQLFARKWSFHVLEQFLSIFSLQIHGNCQTIGTADWKTSMIQVSHQSVNSTSRSHLEITTPLYLASWNDFLLL